MRFVVVGNPENRRLQSFAAAVRAAGHEPEPLAWLDLLQGRVDLAARCRDAVVKLDSPGEDFAVERELLALGAGVEEREHPRASALSAPEARALIEERGRLRYARQWYRGFHLALQRCQDAFDEAPPRLLLNRPHEIAQQFDKPSCHRRLQAAGVAVAPALPGPLGSYVELRAAMRAAGWARVFVKLSWSSSAAGVLALQTRGARVIADTTVESTRSQGELRLYNSLRLRRYQNEQDVAAIVDALAAEGVHVERWIPKAALDDKTCDLRVLVVGGRARHSVVRASRGPLTNLHLGNERGDLGALRERLGPAGWTALRSLAERAGSVWKGLYAGVDLLIDASWQRQVVLEVNAFGDLLPNLTHEGEGCYAAQVSEALRRLG